MAGKGLISALTAAVLVLNFTFYAVVLGLSGWALNELIDNKLNSGNRATPYVIIFACISGVVGVAAVLIGLYSLISKRPESNDAAAASGLIAWTLTILTFGLVAKQINVGGIHSKRLRALEAFSIILGATQLLYVVLAYVGLLWMYQPKTTTASPNEKFLASQDTAA